MKSLPGELTENGKKYYLASEVEGQILALRGGLNAMLNAFDNSENRNAERWPLQAKALCQAYHLLGMPWPTGGTDTGKED